MSLVNKNCFDWFTKSYQNNISLVHLTDGNGQ